VHRDSPADLALNRVVTTTAILRAACDNGGHSLPSRFSREVTGEDVPLAFAPLRSSSKVLGTRVPADFV
jgi:hypothetical protein